jgi:hypothetical protein
MKHTRHILMALIAILFLSSLSSTHAATDTTGDKFFGLAGGGGMIADERQFMPVFYSMFEASPGLSASSTGTPVFQQGAVSAVIGVLRNLTVIPTDGSKSAAKYVWGFFILLSTYGILHSGIMTYIRVAKEGEPVGQASLNWLIKVGIVIFMINWVVAGAPRVMIRLVDNLSGLTPGQISAYTSRQIYGNMTAAEKKALQQETEKFYGMTGTSEPEKWAMKVMTPARIQFIEYYTNAMNALEGLNEDELQTAGAIAEARGKLAEVKSGYETYWAHMATWAATGEQTADAASWGPHGWWTLGDKTIKTVALATTEKEDAQTVTARAEKLSRLLNLAYFPKVYNHVALALGNQLQSPMHLAGDQIPIFNGLDSSDVRWQYALFGAVPGTIGQQNLSGTTMTELPDNSAILLNAFPKTDIDWQKVALPGKIIQTALKAACMMLGIAIWGLPLGLLVWSAMYALPKEFNTGSVLTKCINTVMTITLTGILLGSAFVISQQIETSPNWGDTTALEKTTGKYLAQMIAGSSIEAALLAAFILATPGIAAKIVQGVNGLADGASKVMESTGRTSAMSSVAGGIGEVMGGPTGSGLKAAAMMNPIGMTAMMGNSLVNMLQGKR